MLEKYWAKLSLSVTPCKSVKVLSPCSKHAAASGGGLGERGAGKGGMMSEKAGISGVPALRGGNEGALHERTGWSMGDFLLL